MRHAFFEIHFSFFYLYYLINIIQTWPAPAPGTYHIDAQTMRCEFPNGIPPGMLFKYWLYMVSELRSRRLFVHVGRLSQMQNIFWYIFHLIVIHIGVSPHIQLKFISLRDDEIKIPSFCYVCECDVRWYIFSYHIYILVYYRWSHRDFVYFVLFVCVGNAKSADIFFHIIFIYDGLSSHIQL